MKRPWTQGDRTVFISPEPVPREAMTSWLLRTAAAHACTWTRMRDSIGLEKHEDADFTWPWDLRSSSHFLAVSIQALEGLLGWTESFVAQARAYDLVKGSACAPEFRFCSHCVREQNVMHYSVEGRFEFVTLCPRHGTPMRPGRREDVYQGTLCRGILAIAQEDCVEGGPEGKGPRQEARFALELRIRAAMKCGFERSAIYGTIPARTLIAAESWRLRPYDRRLALADRVRRRT